MVTSSLGLTLLQGDWSCQQPPYHCEHRHTECPEGSSLSGLAKMIDTDVVSRSICLKPILCITIQIGWLWRQPSSQSFFPIFPCLVCHNLQRMRLSQSGPYHPMATGDWWSSPQCLPAISHTQSSVSTKHLGVIKLKTPMAGSVAQWSYPLSTEIERETRKVSSV